MSIFRNPEEIPKSLYFADGKWHLRYAENKPKPLCRVVFCRNAAKKTICEKCKSRKFRINNFEKYAFHSVRISAQKRQIWFDLFFDEFLRIPGIEEYLERKGHAPLDLHIDRKDPKEGYHFWNVQITTAKVNCGKDSGHRKRKSTDDDGDPF